MNAALALLQEKLGYHFRDMELAHAAVTHPSKERGGERGSKKVSGYERLEFLGDRVLSLAMAEWLYELYPLEKEGELAKRHAALVNRDMLAEVADTLMLGDALQLINPEDLKRGRVNMLSDALEALIGALYLDMGDAGMPALRALLRRLWQPGMGAALTVPQDPKSALQEWAQARGLPLPEYKVVQQEGPAHAPRYVMEVVVRGIAAEQAEGTSKREAEKKAAEVMLSKLGKEA